MEIGTLYGFAFTLAAFGAGWAAGAIPRGLDPSLSSMYDPLRDFTCLDGSRTFPFDLVNDDFCDCQDGSDEPGTSACQNGSFFCENAGFESRLVLSSRVNDGICDCCDGTDEWAGPVSPDFSHPCVDTCLELGAEVRAQREHEVRVAREGFAIRQSMVKQAEQVLLDTRNGIEAKERELEQLRAEVQGKLERKQAAEVPENEALSVYREQEEKAKKEKEEFERLRTEAEALAVFDNFDADKDGQVSKAEIMTEQRFDTNNDGIVSEEEAEFYMAGNEAYQKDHFLVTGWPLMRPVLTEEEDAREKHHRRRHHRKVHDHHEDGPKAWNEAGQEVDAEGVPLDEHHEEEEDEELEEEYDDYTEGEGEREEVETERPDRHLPDDKLPSPPENESKYDEATRLLIEVADKARSEYDEADRRLKSLEAEINGMKSTLETHYGEENVFLPLKNQCFDFKDNDYTYRMCAFGSCTQEPSSGGHATGLGSWERWDGPVNDPYSKMLYSNGEACWNGPARSTRVKLVCGTDNVVEAVSEPNRCEYEMVFRTPGACASSDQQGEAHDEL